MTWTDEAKCKGLDTDLFFEPEREDYSNRQAWLLESQRKRDKARSICSGCPVAAMCLADNLTASFGVFGGKSHKQRMSLAKKTGKYVPQTEMRGQYSPDPTDRRQLIMDYWNKAHSIADIEDLTGINRGYISRVVRGVDTTGVRFYQNWNAPEYQEIRELLREGYNAKHIHRLTGVHYKKVQRIRHSMDKVREEMELANG